MGDFTLMVAVPKYVIAHDLIDPIIPDFLRTAPQQTVGENRYWRVEDYNFHANTHSTLEAFFTRLDTLFPHNTEEHSVYGAIMIGSNSWGHKPEDVKEWGEPGDFSMEWELSIVSPMDQGIT